MPQTNAAVAHRGAGEQHGARARRGRQRLPCLVPMQAAAGGSPALLALLLEQCPPPGLACRLSARRRVALPPDTATRGRTVSQLPSGVDGISFTVHPLGSHRPSDPLWTARIHRFSHGCEGNWPLQSPRLLVEVRSRGAASRRTPASPQALVARASSRSSFELQARKNRLITLLVSLASMAWLAARQWRAQPRSSEVVRSAGMSVGILS